MSIYYSTRYVQSHITKSGEPTMKIMICGKGGCGKSTLTVLLAKKLTGAGRRVLVVDADESNLCLHRLLGAKQPEIMMDAMGGRKGTREKLKQATDQQYENDFLKNSMAIDDLPADCLTEVDNINLLVVGKIKKYGEGCACMIGGISKAVLSRLHEKQDEVVLIDAEAGLEHFGRQVDRSCDLALCVIDPSYESIRMADRVRHIAETAGVPTYFLLNKVDSNARDVMDEHLDSERVIGIIPHNNTLFTQCLKGEPLAVDIPQIEEVITFLLSYKKPLTLSMQT